MEKEIPDRQLRILATLYEEHGKPLDTLPYSTTLELIFAQLVVRTGCRDEKTGCQLTIPKVWGMLLNLRKAGRLPKTRKKITK